MNTKSNIYPNSGINSAVENSDNTKQNLAFCFSGGGSRALTCAWGQMMGLSELNLMDKARYVSSVSGGTWASSIYAFLPQDISTSDLLGKYYSPKELSLSDNANNFNVNNFQSEHAYGTVPNTMYIPDLVIRAGAFFFLNKDKPENFKWLWAHLISDLVLQPYGLQAQGTNSWSSSKSFSLSEEYAKNSFPTDAPDLENFYFVRNSNRPFLIMNNNLMHEIGKNIVQVPNQVTPVAGGVKGETPDKEIIGGGLVQSYGVCSILNQTSANTSPVDITINQDYSLIDIVSTSSAFFAEVVTSLFLEYFEDENKRATLIQGVKKSMPPATKKTFFEEFEDDLKNDVEKIEKAIENKIESEFQPIIKKLQHMKEEAEKLKDETGNLIDAIIPTYNYWPLGETSKNQETKYTDGGTLENTGILGLLAQTDMAQNSEDLKIIAFDNTDTPLSKKGDKIIAGGQIAPLFGIDFDDDTGEYKAFTAEQKDPTNSAFKATSLIQVFDNSNNEFTKVVNDLYNSNFQNNTQSSAPYCEIQLKTVKNTLANISENRTINLLYTQNAKMLDWQDNIGDASLKAQIEKGQDKKIKTEKVEEIQGKFKDFEDFPYYSTFKKIGLAPKESNALSQMWAWAVCDESSTLKEKIQNFIEK